MDRNREARRASSIVGSTGFNRRRHRTNSLRDSPDEDGGVELQESTRLRERVKKDRDRDRERDLRERDLRERERNLRERSSRTSKRRRLTNNRDDNGGADESSDDSLYDEDDEGYEENTTTTTASTASARVRLLQPPPPPPPAADSIPNHHHHNSTSSLISQQQNLSTNSNSIGSNNHNLQQRKSFPPPSKVFKAPSVLKSGDEMIGVSVPRKARSASTKRLQDWISSSSNTNTNNSGGFTAGDPVPMSTPLPAAPLSPSSSNASMRKKLKLSSGAKNGLKLKPPKVSSSKPSSSNDLEIEIAEVLSGLMTQSQGPSSKKEDSRDVNRSSSDGKSRVSSPISNSNSTNDPESRPNSTPLSAAAPKRKRPRQVLENSSYGVRSSPVSAKQEPDQTPNSEIISPSLENIAGSVAENGNEIGGKTDISQEHPALESIKSNLELKSVVAEELVAKEEAISSPKEKKDSCVVRTEEINHVESTSITAASFAATLNKENSMVSEVENLREEKFEIDLMLPPPQVRSSPQRETNIEIRATTVSQKKPPVHDSELLKPSLSRDKEYEKGMASQEKKGEGTKEEGELGKRIENKKMEINLQLDLKKPERDVNASVNELQQKKQNQNQHQTTIKATKEEPHTGQSTTNSLPLSMANWPGVIPPMGYMAPLQGVVPVDSNTITPPPVQPPFAQPRPKRCATHCYIARNIHNLQQLMKMNSFWPAPAAAGSASLYGSKPATDLYTGQNNFAFRGGVNNAAPDNKGPTLVSVPEKASSQSVTNSDSAQRKQQILIQQALPPVAPNNLLGPALIFPMNHQQAAVASAVKSPTAPGGVPSSNSTSTSASAGGAPAGMSFHYPNMASNEQTQYLAILQNNAYPFPIQAVGAPPNYRGAPAQGAMPLFNGSFYSSQIIHPSQLQHQQQQQLQQAHQNASVSGGGSSSSQKHLQRSSQSSGVNGGTGSANLQNFPTQKSQSSQQLYQTVQNQHVHQSKPRHVDSEPGGSEDSPSTNDSRVSRASMNIYGQNFAMPIHPQNFALASGSQGEKKPQKQQHQGGIKNGVDSLPPHSFAMSFGPINGSTTPQGIDMTTMAQNHAIFQSFPEATRQMMAAAAAAAASQNKNFKISEDGGKSGGGDSSAATATDEERKILAGKSFAFTDGVNESSARSLNVASGPARSSRPASNTGAMNVVPNAHIQAQLQQQQLQMLQHKQQQQQQLAGNAGSRNKSTPVVTNNGSIYSEHFHPSSTMAAKYPNALSGYPQNQSQSQSQSPQWKSSTKTPTPQAPSSLASSTTRTQQQQMHHTQISFGGNQKQSTNSHGQTTHPTNNQSPMIVGSPTNSSISKGANGSPRTSTSTPTNHKLGSQASLHGHQIKKSQSILGNPQVASSSSNGAKPQMQQQSHQQQLPKNMQPAQIFFSNPYSQGQSPHGYYMQQQQLRRPEVHQQPPGAPTPSSSTSNGRTNDPAKAIAAATCNTKGADLPS